MSTVTDPATQLANLIALSDDHFWTLVERNLDRDEQPRLWELLLQPRLVHRTHGVLTAAFRDVEDQLAQRRADLESFRQECFAQGNSGKAEWFAAQGEHQEWRRRAIGYRRVLNRRLADAKNALRHAGAPATPANSAKKARQTEAVFRLAWVISEHRAATLRMGIVPDDHDVELWRALDVIQVDTAVGLIPVSRFLEDITSKPDFLPPDGPAGARPR